MAIDMVQVFRAAVGGRASDVVITAGSPPIFRVNGEVVFGQSPALQPEQTKQLIYDVLRPEQIARFERERELDFSLTVEEVHRFRGNVFQQRGYVGAAFRLIPDKIPVLKDLHLPPVLEEFALSPVGLVLLTGPTGHGKSTTLAALINLINEQRKAHIVTVEDPIEFLHRNKKSVIEQREVGEDTLSFASALKHVLRQAPDVILVGEMRDTESISAAITAAETGHLVLATLHTNDSVQAIDRLIDVFPSHAQSQIRAQLSMSLLAVVAQRLIRTSDGRGRAVACEVLRNNAAVANLIRDGKTHQIYTVMETHARDGMVTLDASLKDLYLTGQIAYEEARRRMRNPSLLEKV
ncbi:MAG: type IV pilus twitching motility protein PilT [Planctomycetes bacterium]|nr:type IV pilus twitching motility protein PilT [Planctomycetota bacterium]